ncbi:MAG: polysaccharide biosynthesis tyrosine autokinase [Phycisphaerae bacterium]
MSVIATRDQAPQIIRGPVGHAARAASAPAGITGRDVLRILRKRKWLIIIVVAVFAALTGGGTQLWMMYAPFYTADGYIEVMPPRDTPFAGTPMYPQEIMESRVAQQARLLVRKEVLDAALADDRITRTTWYQKSRGDAPRRLERDIDITPLAKTRLIRVSMTGRNREELAEIVNALIKAAVDEAVGFSAKDKREEIKQVDDELVNLTGRLNDARKQANDLEADAALPSLRGRQESLSFRMQNLIPEMTKLKVAKAQADESLRMARQMIDTPGMFESSAEAQQIMDQDGTLRSLKMAEANWATELEELKKRFGPNHQAVIRRDGQLNAVREQIDTYTRTLMDTTKRSYVSMREMQLSAITAQLVSVESEYNAAEAASRDLAVRVQKLSALDVTIKDLEDKVKTLSNHKMQTVLLVNVDPPVKLRSPAPPPDPNDPSMPRWSVNMPLGIGLGLLLALGLAFTLELVDTSIKGPSDVSRRVDLPLLGMIPHSDDMEEDIPDLRLAFASHPSSLIGEAFRQVRTCLLFSGPAEGRRSLLVASSLPEDGRTTVALNLAAAMARGGRKVLVVDANFRQPMIRRLFPQAAEAGLSSALVGQVKWQEQVAQVEPNLFVMSSGPLPPNPAELLGSEPMRQIIAEMVAEYDQVIFDSAPSLVVSDSAILSTLVDAVVLTVRAGSNTYGIVQRARDMLNRVGARVVGVVLNGIRVTAGGYLRKNYDAFYDYHTQDVPRLPG